MNKPKASSKNMVYDSIVKDIISGKYEPNTIITEKMLLQRFDVSRAPIREALIELCKDNYLRSIPRTGYMLISYTLKEMVDILDFRVDLETSNLKRAFPLITEEKMRALGDDFMNGYLHPIGEGTMEEHWMANQQFHLDLCSLSDNHFAWTMLKNLLLRNSGYYQYYYKIAWDKGTNPDGPAHVRIIKALLNHDIVSACDILADDINDVKNMLIQVLK